MRHDPPGGIIVCTLRAAIQEANALSGVDTINFNNSGAGPHTISPSSSLPEIIEQVTIDGYTEPGATVNNNTDLADGSNANLLIELDGSGAGVNTSGLSIGNNASNTVIRGLVINRFDGHGILSSSGSTGVKVESNFIGTNVAGDADQGNGGEGVLVISPSSGATIGGTTPDKRNVISGNGDRGVALFSSDHKVEGNLIGTKKDGTSPLGNDQEGVNLSGNDNAVGGTASGANTIAFNGNEGILVNGNNNTIGGAASGAANTIHSNVQDGVRVLFGTGNRILNNSIYSNGELGIDLQGGKEKNGVTKNDNKDPDTGPNNLQNYPVLKKPSKKTPGTINGTLKSTPSTATTTQTFTIQFFSSPEKDLSGFGEGKQFLGETTVTTNSNGNASFTFTPTQAVPAGQFITTTATDASGNTSEFSKAVTAS